MKKKNPMSHFSPSECAIHSVIAMEKAIDADELLKPYRIPITDLIREVKYQTTRANTAEERYALLQAKCDRLAEKLTAAHKETA